MSVTDPKLCDGDANPLPADYDPNLIVACEDCGTETRLCELTDTIAGLLCGGCRDRFMGACRGLLEASSAYAKAKTGGKTK